MSIAFHLRTWIRAIAPIRSFLPSFTHLIAVDLPFLYFLPPLSHPDPRTRANPRPLTPSTQYFAIDLPFLCILPPRSAFRIRAFPPIRHILRHFTQRNVIDLPFLCHLSPSLLSQIRALTLICTLHPVYSVYCH